jgi:hypothetical protein
MFKRVVVTKPIHTNLTQEQRNTCVAAAIKSGMKLSEWAGKALLDAAQRQLSPQAAYGEWDDIREAEIEQIKKNTST